MSQTNRIVGGRSTGGLLLRGALARLQVAIAGSLVLWACVLWACLSHPVPPKPDEPPPSSPPTMRRVIGTGQPTPIGGIFDRVRCVVAADRRSGERPRPGRLLLHDNKAPEGIFLATGGQIAKVAAVGDSVPGGGILTQFAKHPMPT